MIDNAHINAGFRIGRVGIQIIGFREICICIPAHEQPCIYHAYRERYPCIEGIVRLFFLLSSVKDLKINMQKLYRYVNEVLDDREREILSLRYGLDGAPPLTQRETAEKLGISRSYVSRIEKRALMRLKKQLEREEFI